MRTERMVKNKQLKIYLHLNGNRCRQCRKQHQQQQQQQADKDGLVEMGKCNDLNTLHLYIFIKIPTYYVDIKNANNWRLTCDNSKESHWNTDSDYWSEGENQNY